MWLYKKDYLSFTTPSRLKKMKNYIKERRKRDEEFEKEMKIEEIELKFVIEGDSSSGCKNEIKTFFNFLFVIIWIIQTESIKSFDKESVKFSKNKLIK